VAGPRKLIVVANRGPLSYARDGSGARIVKRGGGGLVTALRGLVTQHEVTWIGSAMSDEDRVVSSENNGLAFDERWRDGSPYRLRLVAHDAAAYDAYYNVVANPALWFIHHYLWGLAYAPNLDARFHDAWRDGYARVNESFAVAAGDELAREPSATVFFHDYHLYLAPRLVRDRYPHASLAHFMHIPWPEADYWTVLPRELRSALFDGILANDVVGLHTNRWRRNFLRSCADVLGAEVDEDASTVVHRGRRTLVTARPISIDPAEFDALSDDPGVIEQEQLLAAERPELLVLRVDRTDLSKNILRGFTAFGLLLELHPELRGRVGMLALLDPSRQDVLEYAEYLAAINAEAREINARFRTDNWLPIDLRVADNFAQSVAAYKQYDALLVNAAFDGLNLVSKEAPLVNRRHGAVLLSENAGSYEELREWVECVSPFDLYDQAEALHRALTLPLDERRRRSEAIKAQVREQDLAAWVDGLLEDFDRAAAGAASGG
jgi:trehalose 6-phosphate synthase